jgi:hypothetical protein
MQRDLRPVATAITEAGQGAAEEEAGQCVGGVRGGERRVADRGGVGGGDGAGGRRSKVEGREAEDNKTEDDKTTGAAALANNGTSEGARKSWVTRKKNGWISKEVEEKRKILHDLAAKALSDPLSQDEEMFGTVNDPIAKDIEAVHPGLDPEGHELSLASNDIRHARNQHGTRENKVGMEAEANGKGRFDRACTSLAHYVRNDQPTTEPAGGEA